MGHGVKNKRRLAGDGGFSARAGSTGLAGVDVRWKWSEEEGGSAGSGELGWLRTGLVMATSIGSCSRHSLDRSMSGAAYPLPGALDVYVYNAVTNDQAPLTITELRRSSRRVALQRVERLS